MWKSSAAGRNADALYRPLRTPPSHARAARPLRLREHLSRSAPPPPPPAPGVESCGKSNFYGAFVLNRPVVLHAIDATPARWRGDAGSSPLGGASTAASSPSDLVKMSGAPDPLVDSQVAPPRGGFSYRRCRLVRHLACDAARRRRPGQPPPHAFPRPPEKRAADADAGPVGRPVQGPKVLGRADGVEDLVRDQTFVPANIRGVRRRPAAPKRKRPVSATTTSAPAQIHAAPAPAPAAARRGRRLLRVHGRRDAGAAGAGAVLIALLAFMRVLVWGECADPTVRCFGRGVRCRVRRSRNEGTGTER